MFNNKKTAHNKKECQKIYSYANRIKERKEAKMAKKRKQTKQNQKILTSIIITIIIILIGYYLYYTYSNIEITPQNYETQRTLSTGNEQNVEKAEEKSRTIADTLEKTMESVVGISKLKDNGNSIFSSNRSNNIRKRIYIK